MDTEDFSNIKHFVDALKQNRSFLRTRKRRQGQRLKNAESRDVLIKRHKEYHAFVSTQKSKPGLTFRPSFIDLPYSPSTESFQDLQPIHIKELRLEKHHHGHYIMLRAVTLPTVLTTVKIVMEDENDQVVDFDWVHQETWSDKAVEEYIQLGSICMVKEPYLMIREDGGCNIRVTHPSDIDWIPTDDDKVPLNWQPQVKELKDAGTLKEEGNVALGAGHARRAIQLYTNALQSSPTDAQSHNIELARSKAYLDLGCYDSCIQDAGKLINEVQKSESGYYYTASALYELKKYDECLAVLKLLLARNPHFEPAQRKLSDTEQRLKEQNFGEYDFTAMHEAMKNEQAYYDHASFTGPVEIRDSEGRGRGLFTTKDVTAGTMLLCEKAFSYCLGAKEASVDNFKYLTFSLQTGVLMHAASDRITLGTQTTLITATTRKLYQNPSLREEFFSLYHGGHKPGEKTEVDGTPLVDTFLVSEIIRLNAFGCPRTSIHSHFATPETEADRRAHHTCGIFLIASRINHDCVPNSRRSLIGDMQIIRASRDIPANTEIFLSYTRSDRMAYHEVELKKLSSTWGFQCTCTLCRENSKLKKSVYKNRMTLFEDVRHAFIDNVDNATLNNEAIKKINRLITQIGKTYPASAAPESSVPRLALWMPNFVLTELQFTLGNPNEAINTAWKALRSLSYIIDVTITDPQVPLSTSDFEIKQWGLMLEHVINIWVHLWVIFTRSNCPLQLAAKAEKIARICYSVYVGDESTFDDHYGRVARDVIDGRADFNLMVAMTKLRIYQGAEVTYDE